MSKKLILIEALGKLKPLKSVLSEIFDDFTIIATKGRIYDLPDDELGIDLESYEIKSLKPVYPSIISLINKESFLSNDIYILTDNDEEGEVIAYQLNKLINKPTKRIRSCSFAKDDIIAAFGRPSSIDKSMVETGLAKRIFDRIIGYRFSNNHYSEGEYICSVGRVITPTLNILQKEMAKPNASIMKPILANGELAHLNIQCEQKDKDSVIHNIENSELDIDVSWCTNKEFSEIKPLNGFDCIQLVSENLDVSILKANSILQDLYMKGKISYFRTRNRLLSHQRANEFTDNLFNEGIVPSDKLFSYCHNSSLNHEAVLPILSKFFNAHVKDSSLTLEDRALKEIFSHYTDLNYYDKKEVSYGVAVDPYSNSVLSFLEHSKIPYKIIKKELKGKKNSKSFYKNDKMFISHCNNDHIVFNILKNNNLCPPSTIANFSSTIANKFLNEDGSINKVAHNSLSRAYTACPKLLELENFREIQSILNDKSIPTYKKVVAALEESDILLDNNSDMLNATHYGDI